MVRLEYLREELVHRLAGIRLALCVPHAMNCLLISFIFTMPMIQRSIVVGIMLSCLSLGVLRVMRLVAVSLIWCLFLYKIKLKFYFIDNILG
jgi:hypothetical protein